MSQIMKHLGKYGEKPCIILFREVPNEPENCLIIQTSILPASQHDDLMEVVQSAEAQAERDLSNVLHRRQFKTGENMLSALHFGKYIQKVPVSQVFLAPTPGQTYPLADVNAEIRRLDGGYVPPKNSDAHLEQVNAPRPSVPNTIVDESLDRAAGLRLQAALMKEDAERLLKEAAEKEAEAYNIEGTKESKPSKKKA